MNSNMYYLNVVIGLPQNMPKVKERTATLLKTSTSYLSKYCKLAKYDIAYYTTKETGSTDQLEHTHSIICFCSQADLIMVKDKLDTMKTDVYFIKTEVIKDWSTAVAYFKYINKECSTDDIINKNNKIYYRNYNSDKQFWQNCQKNYLMDILRQISNDDLFISDDEEPNEIENVSFSPSLSEENIKLQKVSTNCLSYNNISINYKK